MPKRKDGPWIEVPSLISRAKTLMRSQEFKEAECCLKQAAVLLPNLEHEERPVRAAQIRELRQQLRDLEARLRPPRAKCRRCRELFYPSAAHGQLCDICRPQRGTSVRAMRG